jgi:hypothetical protein
MSKKLADVERSFKKARIMAALVQDSGDNLPREEQIIVNAAWEILRLEHKVAHLETLLGSRKLRDLVAKSV